MFYLLVVTEVEEIPEETVTIEVTPKPKKEVPEKETLEITFAPEEAPKPETVEVTFAPKPTEEAPERETVEVTFAPKPEEAPEPETVEVTFAPKPTEEAPERETIEVTFTTPKPKEAPEPEEVKRKPTSPWEAPEDFEIVIEKFKEVPEDVPTEVTTVEVTKVVKEEGTCICMSKKYNICRVIDSYYKTLHIILSISYRSCNIFFCRLVYLFIS